MRRVRLVDQWFFIPKKVGLSFFFENVVVDLLLGRPLSIFQGKPAVLITKYYPCTIHYTCVYMIRD